MKQLQREDPMKRCVIIGGASILDHDLARSYLREGDVYFFCDSGLKHRQELRVTPDVIIGDLDSWRGPLPETDAEVIVLPRKKDDTDTIYAIKEGLKRGYRTFLLLGVTGQRLDHTLANVYALLLIEESGGHGLIADDLSEMELVSSGGAAIPDTYPFFSLISLAGTAEQIRIRNAVFPLSEGVIRSSYQYAVSNEVIPGKTAYVSVGEGSVLLIRIRKDGA